MRPIGVPEASLVSLGIATGSRVGPRGLVTEAQVPRGSIPWNPMGPPGIPWDPWDSYDDVRCYKRMMMIMTMM